MSESESPDIHPQDQETDALPSDGSGGGDVSLENLQDVVIEGDVRGGDQYIYGDQVGGDKVTNITNVTTIIRTPSLWQRAIWGFVRTHRLYLLLWLLLQTGLFVLFWLYKDLYLIGWWYWLICGLVLTVSSWAWYQGLTAWRQGHLVGLRLVVAGVSSVLLLLLLGNQAWRIYNPPRIDPEVFGIAVAELGEGAGYRRTATSREITDEVYRSLCNAVQEEFTREVYGDPCAEDAGQGSQTRPVAIIRLGVIPDDQTARALGSRVGADIVIWGRVRNTRQGITVDYEILETLDRAVDPDFPLSLPVTTDSARIVFETNQPVDEEEVETAVSDLGRNIAFYTLGLQAYLDERYSQSLDYFTDIEEAVRRSTPELLPISDEGLSLLYLYLARSLQMLHRTEEGQDWLLQAQELNSAEPAIPHSLALGYGQLEGFEDQRDDYFEQALVLLNEWLSSHGEDNPAYPLALYDRAQIYRVYQKPAFIGLAEADFRAAIEIAPAFYVPYIELGWLLFDQGRYEEAGLVLKDAIAIARESGANPAEAYALLGCVLDIADDAASAAEAYQSAVEAAPQKARIRHAYAQFLEAQGDLDAAAAQYEAMGRVAQPGLRAWAYEAAAEFWRRRGLPSKAVEQYRLALLERPDNAAYISARLGETLYDSGQVEDALAVYDEAVAENPALYYLYSSFASRLERGADPDQWERAVAMYQRSLEERPQDFFALFQLSGLWQRLERIEEAVAALEQIVEDPQLFNEEQLEQARQRLESLTSPAD